MGVKERARIREETLLCGDAVNAALDNARESSTFSARVLLSDKVVEALLPEKFCLFSCPGMLADKKL